MFCLFEKPISDYHYSELTIQRTNREHSGNYTCVPSNAQPAFVLVHIFKGEYYTGFASFSRLDFSWNSNDITVIYIYGLFCLPYPLRLLRIGALLRLFHGVLSLKQKPKICFTLLWPCIKFSAAPMWDTMYANVEWSETNMRWPIALTISQILLKWIANAIWRQYESACIVDVCWCCLCHWCAWSHV